METEDSYSKRIWAWEALDSKSIKFLGSTYRYTLTPRFSGVGYPLKGMEQRHQAHTRVLTSFASPCHEKILLWSRIFSYFQMILKQLVCSALSAIVREGLIRGWRICWRHNSRRSFNSFDSERLSFFVCLLSLLFE